MWAIGPSEAQESCSLLTGKGSIDGGVASITFEGPFGPGSKD